VTGESGRARDVHTVLLETQLDRSGHPTGGAVTFTNSYAIEVTTSILDSGNVMWDELQVVLPTGQDPYPVIDAIQKGRRSNHRNAKQAEQEWKNVARSRQVNTLSAAPAST